MQQKSHFYSLILLLYLTTCNSIYAQVYPDIYEKTSGDTISFTTGEQPYGYLIMDTNLDSFLIVVDDNLKELKEVHNSDILKLPSGIRSILIASQFNADVKFNILISDNSTAQYRILFNSDLDINTYYKISSYPHLISKVKPIEDLIETEGRNVISFVNQDDPFGYLRINTNIDSFFVVINNDFEQYQKMYTHDYLKIPVGKRRITVVSKFDQDRTFERIIKDNSVLEYEAILRKRSFYPDYLNQSSYPRLMKGVNVILISDDDSEIWLNERKIGLGYAELDTIAQEYLFEARNIFTGLKGKRINVSKSKISVHTLYTKPDKTMARVLSFIPGASQYYKGEMIKGIGLLAASVCGFTLYNKYKKSFNTNYDLYLQTVEAYARTESEEQAISLANLGQSYYDENHKLKIQKNIFLYATLALYLYNLIDAWIKVPNGGYREEKSIDFFNEYIPDNGIHTFGVNWYFN